MQSVLNVLAAADRLVSRIVRAVCIVSMMLIFAMFLMNVFVRFVPVYNFTQTDEWTQLLLVWVIFLGAQELVRTRSHFVVDVLTDRIRGTPAAKVLRIVTCLIELTLYAVICWYGWILVGRSQAHMQTITWLQIKYFYAVIPLSAFFMTCYSVRDLVQALRMPWSQKR